MRRTSRGPAHVTGSGNVFRDLRVPGAEEELTKSALLFELGEAIKSRGLRQVEAAKLLGIPQPQVSNLLRGRTSGFSVQRLSMLLARLGKGVTIVVSDTPHRDGLPRVPVVRDSGGVVSRMVREGLATDGSRAVRYRAPAPDGTRTARRNPSPARAKRK